MSCGVSRPSFPVALLSCPLIGKTFKHVLLTLHVSGGVCVCRYYGLLSFPVKLLIFFFKSARTKE